jgi:hypothetical protein
MPAKEIAKNTEAVSKANNAVMNKVMPILLVQHNVAALGKARQEAKVAGLEKHVQSGIENGLTLKMVDENLTAGRPPHFVETGE